MLKDLHLQDFLKELSSDRPVPGGGSASALASCLGLSLTMMVANLTVGKKKYEENESLVVHVKKECEELYQKVLNLIDADAEAFRVVSNAYQLPKMTDEEKELRSAEIQKGLVHAASVPLLLMEHSLKGLELTQSLLGKSNTNAASDLGVAALNLLSGLKGAYLNVMINISGRKETDCLQMLHQADMIYQISDGIAKNIYNTVKLSF